MSRTCNDALLGKNIAIIRGQGWLCVSNATVWRDRVSRWILLAIPDLFVYDPRPHTEWAIPYRYNADRFYGGKENAREVEMDMREMVDKVKKGEPLYGKSTLTPYMQGVASRNSRYSATFMHVIPWFNFVNHEQVLSFTILLSSRSDSR